MIESKLKTVSLANDTFLMELTLKKSHEKSGYFQTARGLLFYDILTFILVTIFIMSVIL